MSEFPNKAKNVEIYTQQIKGRLFVVGDIHGSYNLLKSKLAEINFDYANDLLVSVGDLVDRGQQNYQCVELINQPWFKAVRGNHEQMCIEGFTDFHIANQHAQSNNGGEWFYRACAHSQKYFVELFKSLPIALEINFKGMKYGFVHAHVEQNDWHEFKAELLAEHVSGRDPGDMAMWCRERVYAPKSEKKYQRIRNIDQVYFGHTILPRPMKKHNCYFIDTGAFHTGLLTVVELMGAK